MYVVCVTVHVVPESIEQFVLATLENAAATRREPGCARFDVLRAVGGVSGLTAVGGVSGLTADVEPARFFLYEVYREEKDFAVHQQTAHYLAWKEKVAPMMATPRAGVKHVSISPEPWV